MHIKTLQNAHRDEDKLERLLKAKEREKEEANHVQDIQRLVTEIEMLNVVLCLVSRDMRMCTHTQAIILEAKFQ